MFCILSCNYSCCIHSFLSVLWLCCLVYTRGPPSGFDLLELKDFGYYPMELLFFLNIPYSLDSLWLSTLLILLLNILSYIYFHREEWGYGICNVDYWYGYVIVHFPYIHLSPLHMHASFASTPHSLSHFRSTLPLDVCPSVRVSTVFPGNRALDFAETWSEVRGGWMRNGDTARFPGKNLAH